MKGKKPIVFFSHSTSDKQYLNVLKNKIDKLTGGAVDIFLSSDGQSIPFGTNWIHKMEDALKNANLMFVFLSPSSKKSNWIYFESGFSYSRGTDVIPVGILGTNLSKIAPPLNLLQGFNLNSAEGINNIVQKINETFDFRYDKTFKTEDYDDLILPYIKRYPGVGSYNPIDYLEFSFPQSIASNEKMIRSRNYTAIFEDCLKAENIEYGKHKEEIYGAGFRLQYDSSTNISHLGLSDLKFVEYFPVVKKIIRKVYGEEIECYHFRAVLKHKYHIIHSELEISVILSENGMKFSDVKGKSYKFKNCHLLFIPDDRAVEIIFDLEKTDNINPTEIIKHLSEIEVILHEHDGYY